MKRRDEVTFIGSRQFKKDYAGKVREFIELNWIVHEGDNYNGMSALKTLTTVDKLRKALDYRGIQALEPNRRYILWRQDWNGDKKLKFSGIQLADNVK